NAFQENTYVLYDETLEAVVVDPGCYDKEEQQELADFIKNKGLKVVSLINTHCHVDHVLGNSFVKSHFGVKLSIHPKEESTLKSVATYGSAYGLHNDQPA